MTTLDPTTIIVRDRQRKTPEDLDEGFVKSVNQRLIHPIVVQRLPAECSVDCGITDCHHIHTEQTVLVAGGMRLAALIKGGTTPLIEGTHFRYMNDLEPLEAKKIELEENVKRLDLSWREHVAAFGELHALYSAGADNWSTLKTAEELNLTERMGHILLAVYKNLDSPLLKDSQGIRQSYSILQTAADRRTAAIVNDIANIGTGIFNQTPKEESPNGPPSNNDRTPSANGVPSNLVGSISVSGVSQSQESSKPIVSTGANGNPIICADFLKWAPLYTGPKFTLIHCDFPYDVDYSKYAHSVSSTGEDYDFGGFTALLDCLCQNVDRIASYSSHLMFWFSMTFYETTKKKLEAVGFYVHDHPLVWHKTDNSGIIPGVNNQFPRRIYETAFLASRGKRPLIRSLANAYGAPNPSNALHPSQKSESMLKHFLSMLIDETTDVLDPTCGSGSALRAAEDLGARSILGLELNQAYSDSANSTTFRARSMRAAAKGLAL